MSIQEQINQVGILPVVTFEADDDPVAVAQALVAGGINAIEVTFRTSSAAKAIAQIRQALPEMLVGAGTVKTKADVDAAVAAGSQFLLSPCLDEPIVKYALAQDLLFIPGLQTASEVARAVRLGLNLVKFFPALSSGGTSTLKAWHATFPEVDFIPTGGVGLKNMNDFLTTPGVLVIGGSWLTAKMEPTAITLAARQAVAVMLGFSLSKSGSLIIKVPSLARTTAYLATHQQQIGTDIMSRIEFTRN